MKKTALFPGTFDPFTIGHHALIERALGIFDEIIIAIGVNSEKNALSTVEERINNIKKIYAGEPRVKVASYDTLTADFAKTAHAGFILRGVRNFQDFEYEKALSDANRKLAGIETVFMFSGPEYEYVSSSLVRELSRYGKDVSNLIPKTK